MGEIVKCIICFTKCDNQFLLDSEKGNQLNIKEIVLKHFWLEIENNLTAAICSLCWENINSFHVFCLRIENIHKSHNQTFKIIKDSIGNLSFNDDIINNKRKTNLIELSSSTLNGKELIREEVFITVPSDIKDEESENDIYNDKNSNEDEQIDSVSVFDYDNLNDDIDDGYNVNNNDEGSSLPLSVTPSSEKLKTLDTPKEEKTLTPSKKRIRKKKPSLKSKPDYTEINEKLRRYFSFACELCDAQFTEFSEMKSHYAEKHEKEGYIKCCGKKMCELSKVIQHCEYHENPEAFKCESCEKCFTNNYRLKLHIERIHTPASELNFDCDLCDRSYGRKYLLAQHKKATHPREEDKIYNCDACGLKFAVKAFLRAHVKRVHEFGDSRVCDICARFFKCAKAYDHHYLVQHTNTLQKVQCELCGLWVKHTESLKAHMLRKHRTFKKQSCKVCGKTCPNIPSLRSHIRAVHEFIEYPCTICEKSFKKKQSLKEHMAQHTGEKDLYKCLFCTKTFRSNANMYAHRKRAHPKEYEENRLLGKKYPDLQKE